MLSKKTPTTVFVLLLILLLPELTTAQEMHRSSFKFAPSPKSQAKFYGITEFGYYHTISRGKEFFRFEKGSNMASGNIGAMYNLSDKFSVGGSFYTHIGELKSRLGFAPRLRYWINNNFSSDIQAGISISDFGDSDSNKESYIFSASINYRNWISFTTLIERGSYLRSDPIYQSGQFAGYNRYSVNQTNWYGGLKLNSYLGIAGVIGIPFYLFLQKLAENWD